jgi:hypothetical protein
MIREWYSYCLNQGADEALASEAVTGSVDTIPCHLTITTTQDS